MSGVQFNYSTGRNFSLYAGTGLVTFRMISIEQNIRVKDGLFFNFGIMLRLGKSKRIENNILMYDVFDINNSFDPGDNNIYLPNSDIPVKTGEEFHPGNLQYKDLQDLFDTNDLY